MEHVKFFGILSYTLSEICQLKRQIYINIYINNFSSNSLLFVSITFIIYKPFHTIITKIQLVFMIMKINLYYL